MVVIPSPWGRGVALKYESFLGGAHSMIQGRRLGCPLLGKWHLCSFVVSVIGLSLLAADSSPGEAPPACQLYSIRAPRLLLSAVKTLTLTSLYLPFSIQLIIIFIIVTFPASPNIIFKCCSFYLTLQILG